MLLTYFKVAMGSRLTLNFRRVTAKVLELQERPSSSKVNGHREVEEIE
jgi:hypothetical protein